MAKKVVATLPNPRPKGTSITASQLKDVSSVGITTGSNLTVETLDFLKVD